MRWSAGVALLLLLSACATTEPSARGAMGVSPRLANLQRAAELPWADEGRCVVREASQPWPVVVERCFHALDHDRIRFQDPAGRCAVASAGAAALGVGICILAAPEIVAGAVIITGAVVVAAAIHEALEAYELRRRYPEEAGEGLDVEPTQREPVTQRRPKPQPTGEDGVPPESLTRERNADCTPRPVPRLGGDELHNLCANRVPRSAFPGSDVRVNGKNFDALQLGTRTLWEVKTDDFDRHSPHSQDFFVRMKLPEMQRERSLAEACGYEFVVGVRSAAHRAALMKLDPSLDVIVMDWC